jgi:ferritin
MIGKNVTEALNQQVNREFYSAYFYLAMSAHSDFSGLKGCASWFMMKNYEETQHAMKIYKYLLSQGQQITLLPIAQPPLTFDSPLAMFEQTLAHEQGVTRNFNELTDVALSERDHATQIFLQWFITEQVEEEATVSEIINKIKLIGGRGDGLFMIDNQLGQLAATQLATLAAAT